MTSHVPKRKKWTSDCWALSYVAGRTADLWEQSDFRPNGDTTLITKVSEIFQQTIVMD